MLGFTRIISKLRAQGKTNELIRRSAETGFPIVVFMNSRIKILKERQEIELYEFIMPDPILFKDYESFRREIKDKNIKGVLIDDIDVNLEKILGVDVPYATVTAERVDYDDRIRYGKPMSKIISEEIRREKEENKNYK